MKTFLFFLAALAACSTRNDAATLQHDATAIVKYYQPRVRALDERVQQIFKRGTTIPANLPGIDEVGKRLTEARDTILQLNGVIGRLGDSQPSPVERQAETAVKENRIDELRKLVHDTEDTVTNGITVATDDLDAVESWIAQYDRMTAAGTLPKPEVKTPEPPPQPEPAGTKPAVPPPPAPAKTP